MRKSFLIIMFIVLGVAGILYSGQFSKDNAGTTGATFLKLPVGARAIGMGEAFGAVADDVTAIYWNPAGLNQLSKREASVTHAVWLDSIFYDFLAYAQPGVFGGTAGMAINYLSIGKIDKRDITGEKTDTFSPYDMAIILSYARLVKGIMAGANIKYIQQKIDEDSASAFGVDLGGLYKLMDNKLSLGLVVQNIGTEVEFDKEGYPLPFNIKVCSAYMIKDNLNLAFDINAPVDNNLNVHIGGEYVYRKVKNIDFSGRIGYKTTTIKDINALSGLSIGLGCLWRSFGLDYVWVPYGDLGHTHRISLLAKF